MVAVLALMLLGGRADLEAGAVVTLPTLAARLRDPGGPEIAIAPELKNEALFVRGDPGPPARFRAHVARAT